MAHTAVNCFAREETNMYYIYSAIAGSVEIGIICWAITHGMSPAEIIGFGVAYQLGNLVPGTVSTDTEGWNCKCCRLHCIKCTYFIW